MSPAESPDEKPPTKRRGRSKKVVPLEGGEKAAGDVAESGGSAEKRLQRKRKQTIDADTDGYKMEEDAEDAQIGDDASEKGKKTRRSVRLEHRNEVKVVSVSVNWKFYIFDVGGTCHSSRYIGTVSLLHAIFRRQGSPHYAAINLSNDAPRPDQDSTSYSLYNATSSTIHYWTTNMRLQIGMLKCSFCERSI